MFLVNYKTIYSPLEYKAMNGELLSFGIGNIDSDLALYDKYVSDFDAHDIREDYILGNFEKSFNRLKSIVLNENQKKDSILYQYYSRLFTFPQNKLKHILKDDIFNNKYVLSMFLSDCGRMNLFNNQPDMALSLFYRGLKNILKNNTDYLIFFRLISIAFEQKKDYGASYYFLRLYLESQQAGIFYLSDVYLELMDKLIYSEKMKKEKIYYMWIEGMKILGPNQGNVLIDKIKNNLEEIKKTHPEIELLLKRVETNFQIYQKFNSDFDFNEVYTFLDSKKIVPFNLD